MRPVIRRLPSLSPWVPVGGCLLTIVALLCPWARSGTVDRSSIELLGSASALDVLTDGQRIVAAGAWFTVVALGAGALVAAAWGRRTIVAVMALPVGPAMVAAWLAVQSSPLMVRWGAPMGTVTGVTASIAAILVLLDADQAADQARKGTRG